MKAAATSGRKKPGPKPKGPRTKAGAFISRHKYAIATVGVVAAGVAGIVATTKALPIGAATAVGIAIGYLTVTAVGGIGAMAMRDGQVTLGMTLEKASAG